MQVSISYITKQVAGIKNYLLQKTDPVLLGFLLFMLNYRFSLKLVALVGIYMYRPNFKFKRDGIFVFYVSMIGLCLLNYLFVGHDFSYGHSMVVLAGCLLWLGCLLAYHQVKLAIEINEPFKLVNTLKCLVIVNFFVSFFDFIKIAIITHTVNPYSQISSPPYGISSGDLIGGVFGSMHLVNTIACCLLCVFFIYRGLFGYSLLCLIPFLLTGSNLGTLILLSLLLYILFFKKGALYKSFALASIAIMSLFYIKITPDNQRYMLKVMSGIAGQFSSKKAVAVSHDSGPQTKVEPELTKEQLIQLYIRYKQRHSKDSAYFKKAWESDSVLNFVYNYEMDQKQAELIVTNSVMNRKDSLAKAKLKNRFFEYGKLKKFDLDAEAGKITSFKQTGQYLQSSWQHALFGAGVGSFSSRLAFITSGIVDDSRILMAIPHYETQEFKDNHKAVFKYLMFKDDATHSITNLPFCWYNQLLGEYGLIGFLLFVVFYCGFFVKQIRVMTFGRLLFVAILGFFLFDYWYERLSVMIVFEFLLLLDLKLKLTDSKPG